MRFLVAVRPGLMTPTITARMVATFDQLSNGRLLINVVAGGDPVELAGDGLQLKHDQRYEVTGEFLHIFRRVLNGESVDFAGEYLQVQGAKLFRPGIQKPYPELWFGGSSAIGQQIAAQHIDVYLTWGEPPADVVAKIEAVRKAATSLGRSLRFGLRVHIIVRETERQAWEAADDLLRYVSDESIAAVAARLKEYAALGIDTFILSGYPHLEEAYRVAELLFPLLSVDHRPKRTAASYVGPFGDLKPGS